MTKSSLERIAESRRLLQNQYAYLDGSGFYSAVIGGVELSDSPDLDAHLDDMAGFSAAHISPMVQEIPSETLAPEVIGKYSSLIKKKPKRNRHSLTEIEVKAISLQKRIWQDKSQIWPNSVPINPIDILDPAVAFRLLGYDYELDESLGQYFYDGKQFEVAGEIDDSLNQVRISRKFPFDIRNFTAAHELGHALLHEARGLHRDRPVDGSTISRDTVEFEADKFASYFLMPQKLVKACFERRFGTRNFFLNEETAFALARGNSLNLEKDYNSLRDLSRILSSVGSYNGVRFVSLANQFRVSTEAMAIRLEELEVLAI